MSHTSAVKSSNSGSPLAIIIGGIFLVLLIGLALGWFFLRRMLLPESALSANLPPSGARPWSRIRVPNPNIAIGVLNEQAEPETMVNSYTTPPLPAQNDAFTAPTVLAGNGIDYSGFSDGFIPPSPQLFPQNENSMIPPGSGTFPLVTNGFTPASPAFNGMYGLPDDPFASSQSGAASWLTNLGEGSDLNNLAGPEAKRTNVAPTQADLNDPYLAEIIRQYSQKGQAVQPQQMSPASSTVPRPQPGPGMGLQDSW
jgi:hypothetical protein